MKTFLITRPLQQSPQLQQLLTQAGARVFIFPTIIIEPPHDLASLFNGIKLLSTADIAIFTSANAVWQSMSHWPEKISPHLKIVAIGPATAKTLTAYQIPVHITVPSPHTSESLLALNFFNEIKNKSIVIFTGEAGRSLLKTTLEQRGAKVFNAIAYQRFAPPILPTEISQQWKNIDVIVITSCESLTNLYNLFHTTPESILNKTLLIGSQRVLALAKQLGFKHFLQAENTTDQALLTTAKKFLHQ